MQHLFSQKSAAAARVAVVAEAGDTYVLTSLAKSEAQAQLLQLSEDSLDRQQRSVRTAQARGAASSVEVLQSTGRLLQARDARVTAQSDTTRAAIASFRALGGGWQG